jgi:hypothetical protein
MPCWITICSKFAGYCRLYPSAMCDVKHRCGLNHNLFEVRWILPAVSFRDVKNICGLDHNFIDVLEILPILRARNCVYKFLEAVDIIWIQVDSVKQICLPHYTGGQLHTFATSQIAVAQLPGKYHNKVIAILIATNKQQYFDIVLLQGILKHVSATYVAFFRKVQIRIQLQSQKSQNHFTVEDNRIIGV